MCKMLLKGRVSWDVRPLLFLTNNSIRASYEQANMASWNCSFSQSFLRAIGGDWHINRLTHFKYIDNLKRTGLLFSMHQDCEYIHYIVYLSTLLNWISLDAKSFILSLFVCTSKILFTGYFYKSRSPSCRLMGHVVKSF